MSGLDYINEALRPLAVEIASLVPDPKNARKHPERNTAATAESLRANGQAKPIVVWAQTPEQGGQLVIVAGNGTVEAAKRLDWTHVAANVRPFESEQAAIAYALADNRTAELAEWDFEALTPLLAELSDHEELLNSTGYSFRDVEVMLKSSATEPRAIASRTTSAKEIDVDAFELAHKCPRCGMQFDD